MYRSTFSSRATPSSFVATTFASNTFWAVDNADLCIPVKSALKAIRTAPVNVCIYLPPRDLTRTTRKTINRWSISASPCAHALHYCFHTKEPRQSVLSSKKDLKQIKICLFMPLNHLSTRASQDPVSSHQPCTRRSALRATLAKPFYTLSPQRKQDRFICLQRKHTYIIENISDVKLGSA